MQSRHSPRLSSCPDHSVLGQNDKHDIVRHKKGRHPERRYPVGGAHEIRRPVDCGQGDREKQVGRSHDVEQPDQEPASLAISRNREYLADACAAQFTRYPEGLAAALEKISRSGPALASANKVTAPMFIINPLYAGGREPANWFSTHPPTAERVKILRSMGGASLADYERFREAMQKAGTGAGAGSRASMAVTIIGGQAICLLLTLLVTPVIYSLFDDMKAWSRRAFGMAHGKKAEPEASPASAPVEAAEESAS